MDERKALESLTAADVMTASPRTCSTFSTVLEAVMIFRDTDCGAVPILAEGKPVSVLTDRDVALAMADFPDLVRRYQVNGVPKTVVVLKNESTPWSVRSRNGTITPP